MTENHTVIDVEATEIDTASQIESRIESRIEANRSESNHESKQIESWVLASEAREMTGYTDKSSFRRAFVALVENYKVPMSVLRIGEGRNTKYSAYAIELLQTSRTQGEAAVVDLLAKSNTVACGTQENSSAITIRQETIALDVRPLPAIPELNLKSQDLSALTNRTAQLKATDEQLKSFIAQTLTNYAVDKLDLAKAEIDDFIEEIKVTSKVQIVKNFQQGQ